jgi:hypothetical protein
MQWIDVEAEIAARVRRKELRTGLDGCAMSTRVPGARGSSSSARSSVRQHHPEEELAEAARGPRLPDLQTSWSDAVAASACGSEVETRDPCGDPPPAGSGATRSAVVGCGWRRLGDMRVGWQA